jgi:hypothetical protein
MSKHAKSVLRMTATLIAAVAFLFGASLLFAPGHAGAASVTPTVVSGNPSCPAGLTALKVEPVVSGTYTDGTLTVTIAVNSGLKSFSWTSNLGVDVVIVKGGPQANIYRYDPPAESKGDTGLQAPILANGQRAGLSHITFCYDLELTISKTANTTFTRTFDWDVEKSVDPASWDLFNGDTGTSDYTIDITKSAPVDSGWAVSGVITIVNPSATTAATITSVADSISGIGAISVNCGVSFPYTLAAGGTLTCTYTSALPDAASRVNTATVATTGAIKGGTATANVVFGDPSTVVDDSVTLSDTVQGDLGSFDTSDSVAYDRTFTCPDDAGDNPNTATIVGDDSGDELDSDSANVVVNCYELAVTKDATTSFKRTLTYDWTIEKVAAPIDQTVEIGESAFVTYDVTVGATLLSDETSDLMVSGNIVVSNPAPINATLVSVTDLVSPDIAATVDCPSLVVPSGGDLVCTYESALPDASDRTNTATATQQNYDYTSDGTATASGTTDYTGSADVVFGDPDTTQAIDDCVDVSDTLGGFLGSLCQDEAPFTFEYDLDLGQRAECGDFVIDNTATVTTTETGTADQDSATVTVHVLCPPPPGEGCTPGFWKNNLDKHDASQWPVDPDSVSPFGGLTFAEAINQTGGNIIYAHAVAAYLNALTLDGFPYTTDEVIALFNAGDKDALAAANELGCPLSQNA